MNESGMKPRDAVMFGLGLYFLLKCSFQIFCISMECISSFDLFLMKIVFFFISL